MIAVDNVERMIGNVASGSGVPVDTSVRAFSADPLVRSNVNNDSHEKYQGGNTKLVTADILVSSSGYDGSEFRRQSAPPSTQAQDRK